MLDTSGSCGPGATTGIRERLPLAAWRGDGAGGRAYGNFSPARLLASPPAASLASNRSTRSKFLNLQHPNVPQGRIGRLWRGGFA